VTPVDWSAVLNSNITSAYLFSRTAIPRSMALDHAKDGIRVNAVAPGFIDTPRTAAVLDERRQALIAITPLRRAGTPADVAAAVTFLARDDAAFITGVILPVDVGRQAATNSPGP
jgi:NAD(P)-dependent dehydrogenase (short-subunit alcohol dehydrogenase family)